MVVYREGKSRPTGEGPTTTSTGTEKGQKSKVQRPVTQGYHEDALLNIKSVVVVLVFAFVVGYVSTTFSGEPADIISSKPEASVSDYEVHWQNKHRTPESNDAEAVEIPQHAGADSNDPEVGNRDRKTDGQTDSSPEADMAHEDQPDTGNYDNDLTGDDRYGQMGGIDNDIDYISERDYGRESDGDYIPLSAIEEHYAYGEENIENEVENGESKVENVESKVENGESKVENGESKVENGENEVENDENKVETVESKVENVGNEIENGEEVIPQEEYVPLNPRDQDTYETETEDFDVSGGETFGPGLEEEDTKDIGDEIEPEDAEMETIPLDDNEDDGFDINTFRPPPASAVDESQLIDTVFEDDPFFVPENFE